MHVVTLVLGVLLPAISLGYVPYPARNFFFGTDNTPLQSRQFGHFLFNMKAAGIRRDISALRTQNTMQQTQIDSNRILQMQNDEAQGALIQTNMNAAATANKVATAASTTANAASTTANAAINAANEAKKAAGAATLTRIYNILDSHI